MQTELDCASWLQQLLVDLAAAQGQALPVRRLMAGGAAAAATPQQRFDGIKLLLEREQVDLLHGEYGYALLSRGSEVSLRSRRSPTRALAQGELIRLASAIAEANGQNKPAPAKRAAPLAAAAEGPADRTRSPIQAQSQRRLSWTPRLVPGQA